MLYLVLYSLLLCCLVMTLVWLLAQKLNNYSIVDVAWSYNFTLIALLLYFIADGLPARKLLLLVTVLLWGIRLGSHLLIRISKHLDVEDGRYLTLRQEWAADLKLKFFNFYQMQAMSNVFLAIPFFLMANNSNDSLQTIEWLGFGIWQLALIGEATADAQLASFKKDPNRKGRVCNIGLWNYSRHPNYFFEFMIWVGFATMASASTWGILAWISPLAIFYLLFKVTGIPMTEEQALKSKGEEYRKYQAETSVFVPWFKKK